MADTSITKVTQQPIQRREPLETEPGCLEKIQRLISDFFEWLCNLFSSEEARGRRSAELKTRATLPTPIQYDQETLQFYKTLAPLKTIGQTAAPATDGATSTQRLHNAIVQSDKAEDLNAYKNLFYEQHTTQVKRIYTTYFSQTKMMGQVNWIPGNFGLWMAGIALVISHLRQKYGVKEFYACETLEGFSIKLEQFIQDTTVTRGAFVVPSFSSGAGEWCRELELLPNSAQHKMTVVVDKSDGIKIAVLNAQQLGEISPERVQGKDDIWEGWEEPGSFYSQEVVFRAILRAKLPKKSELFFANLPRLHHYGCESFAIQDALAFLRDPAFFTKIKLAGATLQINGFSLQMISELPFACMTGMQSVKGLQDAMLFGSSQDLIVKTKNEQEKNLSDYMSKYTINERNHYITVKSCRYNEIVLQMLKELSQQQIDQRLASALVV